MNTFLQNSAFFGIMITLICYSFGVWASKKFRTPLFHPLLIGTAVIMAVLTIFHIDYSTYAIGGDFIGLFLTPVTVALAVPLYRQLQLLKDNWLAIGISVLSGCISHAVIIIGLGFLWNVDKVIWHSLMPKSVTMAIALGVTEEMNGIGAITIIGVMIAGVLGAIISPMLLDLVKVVHPVARGLAVGSASHAVGTSKMLEEGEVQGAMSSLAIVVTGILTVVVVPIACEFFS